ncbi:MAG TPA: MotA/TolQ/ExbB proton channel family protein [Gammaproteobacteria bacterium]|nr:MotA/TolQ/ExbB proton channel family protein [Gammaproteobacteria bacterium]
MLEIIKAGGPVMWPILLCSVIALGITVERLWSLRRSRIIPAHMVAQVWLMLRNNELDEEKIKTIRDSSPLGRVLAAGLSQRHASRDIMREHVQDIGRHAAHELDRYLNTLGTIAAIAPLLGLLGTVTGMVQVFSTIVAVGVGDPTAMAGGISEALFTTVGGLVVAIPSLIAYRYLRGKVRTLVVDMEAESIKLVEALQALNKGGKRGRAA